MQLNGIKLSGDWGEWLGEKINDGFWIMLHGSPGSGKSHLATQFAGYIANQYKVLYVLSEEGVTESVKKRINKYPETVNVDFITNQDPQEIIATIKEHQYQIVVLDSLQGIHVQPNHARDYVEQIRNLNSVSGIVTVNQNTKDGKARGSLDLSHYADTVIDVSDESGENIATTTKNRTNEAGKSIPVFYEIENSGELENAHRL